MEEQEILEELESAVEAMEQALIALTSAVAEQSIAGTMLRDLMQAETALGMQFGANGWRDRFLRKMAIRAAQVARRQSPDDPALQTLAASILRETPDAPDWH